MRILFFRIFFSKYNKIITSNSTQLNLKLDILLFKLRHFPFITSNLIKKSLFDNLIKFNYLLKQMNIWLRSSVQSHSDKSICLIH